MRQNLSLAACVMAGILNGCAAQHLEVERMRGEGRTVEGICYALPKTVLQVTFAITIDRLVRPDDWKRVGGEPEYVGGIRVTADLVPQLVADTRNTFVIKGDKLSKAALLATNLSYQFDDQGLLLAADTQISDRTGEVIKELATTAVELARIATRDLPERTPADDLQDRIEQIYHELGADTGTPRGLGATRPAGGGAGSGNGSAVAEGGGGGGGPETPGVQRIRGLQQELMLLKEALKQYKEDHQVVRVPVTIPFSVSLNPGEFVRTPEGLEMAVDLPQVAGQNLPRIYIRILDAGREVAGGPTGERFDGLVYRPARSVLTQVLAQQGDGPPAVIGSKYISYPQFSPLAVVRIESKTLGESVTRVAFSPVGGGVRTVNGNANSSAEVLVQAASVAATTAANNGPGAVSGKGGGVVPRPVSGPTTTRSATSGTPTTQTGSGAGTLPAGTRPAGAAGK